MQTRDVGRALKANGAKLGGRVRNLSFETQRESGALLEAEYEVQREKAQPDVRAGISGLRLLINFSYLEPRMPVSLSILTATSGNRGVHMSRLVVAAHVAARNAQKLEDYLSLVCREVDLTQPGASVQCEFELPFSDQFAKIQISGSRKQPFSYSFTLGGVTSCPCSKRLTGVGHMQRASLTMEIDSSVPLSPSFFSIVGRLAECFSSTPIAFLKRAEEARVVTKSQENSKFVEDVARECLTRFPDAKRVEVRSFESIHAHDAVAVWAREANGGKRPPPRKGGGRPIPS